MKIAYIPKAAYKIGQTIQVHGAPAVVVSYSHTGRNLIVKPALGARMVCICTDAPAIEGITA